MGQQHSHSHGEEESHGHSHGGKPCHGHGEPKPQPEQHGHSHGGKPCHGHGEPKPQPQQHGHSHGGKPCHGHGPAAQQQQNGHGHSGQPTDPLLEQRIRALQLFVQTMLFPKMPIVFGKFHPSTSNKPPLKSTSTFTIPDNADESMTMAEFKEFITAYLRGLANYEGHGVVVENDINEMTQYFTQKFTNDVITQPDFISVASMVLGRTCMTKWEAAGDLFEQVGLNFMKLPKIPTDPETAIHTSTHTYTKQNILPHLTEHINVLLDKLRDEEDANVRVVEMLKKDICDSLGDASMAAWKQNVERIPSEIVVSEFNQDRKDGTLNSALLAHFVCTNFITQMLILQPSAAADIVSKWGVELQVVKETGELQ